MMNKRSSGRPEERQNTATSRDDDNEDLCIQECSSYLEQDSLTDATTPQARRDKLNAKEAVRNKNAVNAYKKQHLAVRYKSNNPSSQKSSSATHRSARSVNEQKSFGQLVIQYLPQVICISIFAIVVCICIFDFSLVKETFHKFIAWVQQNPFLAILAIICLYSFCLVLTLPITLNHIMLGFTYSQVFQSQLKGFFFAVPIILASISVGSLLSFLLSRYLFRDVIRGQIEQYAWLRKNFRAIDELLKEEGIVVVALCRLTFLPFGLFNYVMGVTSIEVWDFVLGTLCYGFNFSMQVFIGCSFYSIQQTTHMVGGSVDDAMSGLSQSEKDASQRTQNIVLIVEIVLSIIITIVMGTHAKNMVQAKLESFEQHETQQEVNSDENGLVDANGVEAVTQSSKSKPTLGSIGELSDEEMQDIKLKLKA